MLSRNLQFQVIKNDFYCTCIHEIGHCLSTFTLATRVCSANKLTLSVNKKQTKYINKKKYNNYTGNERYCTARLLLNIGVPLHTRTIRRFK